MMWLDTLITLKKTSKKTIKQISDESGVPVGTLNKLFAGQTKDPKLDTIRSVVHTLGYTLDDLEDAPQKNSPSADESAPEEETVSLEESTQLLVALGFINEGQQLSDDDFAFLRNILGLLDTWFGKHE